jgi:hypothetical protein
MNATFEVFGYSFPYARLAETESLSRVIKLGLSTALKNSHAGLEAALRKEKPTITDEEVKRAIADKMAAKATNILSGEWNVRESSGPVMTSRDKMVRSIGMDELRAELKKRKVAWNAGKGATDAEREAHLAIREKLFERLATKRRAAWEAEADRRIAAMAPADDSDADDLFGDLIGSGEADADGGDDEGDEA